ncbi:MAG: extracellular solute-binding protein [Massilia sp.]|nr:extracellular solute-binding protein [Massilia sp.]
MALMAMLAACQRGSIATPAAASSPQKITLTALIWAPDWPNEMHQIAAEFTRLNPDIVVNVQFMIGNSAEENIKPKIASRNLPDLMSVNSSAYTAALAEQGVLADVGHTAAWGNVLPSLKPDWISPGGKRFGIAGGVAAPLIYYNKRMFAQAGVKQLPSNFSEFLALCARLKRAGFTPIVWNGGFPNNLSNGAFSAGFANNVVARTPDWKARIADGTLDLANANGADIFAKILQVAERGYVPPNDMQLGYDEGIRMFTEGKSAMAFQGNWSAGQLMHGKGFQTGVFVPPWNDAGAAVPVIGSETGFAVCETPRKAQAIRFLEFLMGAGFPILQNKRQNISPLLVAPGVMISDPQMVAYIDALRAAPVTGSPYYSMLPTNTLDLLHPLIQDVLFGKVTPRQAAAMLDASIRDEAKKHHK